MNPADEIGTQRLAHELKERTVYVLGKEGRPYMTNWFVEQDGTMAHFLAGVTRVHLFLTIRPDGTLADDSGMEIKIFDYLGEV